MATDPVTGPQVEELVCGGRMGPNVTCGRVL